MEEVLTQLSVTKVQLAVCEEAAQEKSEQLRCLQEENCRMTIMVERLLSEKRQLTQDITSLSGAFHIDSKALSKSSSDPLPLKQDRELCETEADSPRFRLMTEVNDTDAGIYGKCRHILANWEKQKGSKKLRKVVRTGFSRRLRGDLWVAAIGNGLHLSPTALSTFSLSAKAAPGEEYTAVSLIPLDVRRTLIYLQAFQEDQPLHQPLKSLLTAFAELRPDIGYVQGMAYIGSVLLLHLHPNQAFISFANLLTRRSQLLYDFYTFDVLRITRYYKVFEWTVANTVPKVCERLKELSVATEMYLLEWLYTLFVRCVNIEDIGQVWDYVFTEGETAYIKIAVGLLARMENVILEADLDAICKVFDQVPQLVGDVRELLKCANRVSLSETTLKLALESDS